MPSSQDVLEEYARLLLQLDLLIRRGDGDSDAADALRDEMDAPWDRLSPLEIARVRGLSADLYALKDDRRPPAAVSPNEGLAARLREAESKGDWDGALALVRQDASVLPPQQVAFFKGVYWAHLGGPAVALPFLEHAVRTEPRALPIFLLTLARLGMLEEVARLVIALATSDEPEVKIPESVVKGSRECLRLREKLRELERESQSPGPDAAARSTLNPREIEAELQALQSRMAMELERSAA